MTTATDYAVPDDAEQVVVRLLQVVLLAIAAVGVYRGMPGMVFNGLVPFGITLIPGYLREEEGVQLQTGLAFLITAAVVVHATGVFFDLYKSGPVWFDDLAHALSSAVVALSGFALIQAVDLYSDELDLPEEFLSVFILLFVLAFGVAWEVLEFASGMATQLLGLSGGLIQFGWRDIVSDMMFNTLGGILVAVFGPRYFDTSETPADLAEEMEEADDGSDHERTEQAADG